MLTRRMFALMVFVALAALPGGARLAFAQTDAPACTNAATLVDKQVPPDDRPLAPGEAFTVTWQLENTGDCTWTRTYGLLPIDGEQMGGPASSQLRASVRPGRRATLTLALVAPDEPGFHQSIWRLSDAVDGVPFGPWLAVEVEVAPSAARVADDDVVLPEVLVLGGRGGGGGDFATDPCVVDGEVVTVPTLVLESAPVDGARGAYGYVCGYPLGATVAVTLTSPSGETFGRVYPVEDANIVPDEGDAYTRPIVYFAATWLDQAPSGRWIVTTTDGDRSTTDVVTVPDPVPVDSDAPRLDSYPLGSIDPFTAAEGCHYAYAPGEQFIIAGSHFTPTVAIHLGVYQERAGLEYLVDSFRVTTDRRGEFTKLYAADEPAYGYAVHVISRVDPAAFVEGSPAYDPFLDYDTNAWSCFSVREESGPGDSPPSLQLAFVAGEPGARDLQLLHIYGGYSDAPIYGGGNCDTGDPTWWPDGEWVVYSSNCTGDLATELPSAATDYDLYAYRVFTWDMPGGAPMTDTPDVDETEPDIAADGRIVYRAAPAGSSLGDDGELWVLSASGAENQPLGVTGRVPAWSPDGKLLAYMSAVSGDWRIYVYDLRRDQSRLVSEDCPTQCRFPVWSPDGQWLLYNTTASRTDFTATGLWLVPASGGAAQLWLDGPYGRPTWSGTGWVAFNGPDGLYRARAGDAPIPERYLINAYAPDQPYWGPVWSR